MESDSHKIMSRIQKAPPSVFIGSYVHLSTVSICASNVVALGHVAVLQEALVLLGVLYARNKQRQPALTKFKRALELNPLLSDAWIAQAQVRRVLVYSLPVYVNICRAYVSLFVFAWRRASVTNVCTYPRGAFAPGRQRRFLSFAGKPRLRFGVLVDALGRQVLQEEAADHKLALSSYSKGLGNSHAAEGGSMSAGSLSDTSGLETHQAAWTNIAVLHEHMVNPVEAMLAYQHALSEKGPGRQRADDGVDSEALLRITDSANELFWEWKELPTTASVVKGSRMVRTSASVGGALRKGTQVRVGEHYVTTAQGPEKQGVFEVADVAPDGMDDLALEGTLYKKVHKTRVSKENVSMVFNLALLHEKQGHHEAAQELHKAVLAEHPTYVHSECILQYTEAGPCTPLGHNLFVVRAYGWHSVRHECNTLLLNGVCVKSNVAHAF